MAVDRISHAERRERRRQWTLFVAKGHTVDEAAVKFDTSVSAIQTACREFGVSVPRRFQPKVTTYDILYDLLYTDLSIKAIADKHQVIPQRVSAVCTEAKAAGIKIVDRVSGNYGHK